MAQTSTITVNVDEKTEKRFRAVVVIKYGKGKGILGKALTEAMNMWAEQKARDVNAHALALLEKGLDLGGITDMNRGRWHER